jgi:hypothetical protein
MKKNKNFFINLQSDQEILVFSEYHFFEDTALDNYPFDSLLKDMDFPKVSVNFWKKHLNREFIVHKNFHIDFLNRTDDTSKKRWADYKNIPVNELTLHLMSNANIEEETNQNDYNEAYFHMKNESLFNDSLRFGVTPNGVSNISHTYKLQEADSLYTEIAKLEVFDLDSLLRFSRHFGLPSGIKDDTGFDYFLNVDSIFFPFGSVSVLNKKIAIYKQSFEWFKLIKTNNFTKIRSLLTNSDIKNNADVIELAKQQLVSLLSKLDTFPFDTYPEYQDDTIIPKAWFKDLFNFAYFQLAKALSDDVEVRKCDFCGHLFEVKHKRQRFCPALPNRKRSSCEMAYNNRLKKQRGAD